jgi:hypothetical protein
MHARLSSIALLSACGLAACGLAGCGARSQLTAERAATTSASTTTTGTGGRAPLTCGLLSVTPPAAIDATGPAERPALVFGSNNGQVVSVFHAVPSDPAAGVSLDVTTVTPWESWPPGAGDGFVFDAQGGRSFAVGDALLGNVAALFWHPDADPASDGLAFANGVPATFSAWVGDLPLSPSSREPEARVLVRGHDAPPVALNVGYVAMLATWDEVDPTSGAHALRMGVGAGQSFLLGLATHPDDDDLACASAPIAAAAVRAGESWLVLAGSGSDLTRCDGASSASSPTALVVDRVTWSAPEEVSWSVTRVGAAQGAEIIEAVRMIPWLGGGLAAVTRGGRVDLVRVEPSGAMTPLDAAAPLTGLLSAELAPLGDGALLAGVAGSDRHLELVLLGPDGSVRDRATVADVGPVASLSALGSKAGDGVLLGWATESGKLQLARVGCTEGT